MQLTNCYENFGRCPNQLPDQGQTTTMGTAFPTLCLNRVSSLTSPANPYGEDAEDGTCGLSSSSEKTISLTFLQVS